MIDKNVALEKPEGRQHVSLREAINSLFDDWFSEGQHFPHLKLIRNKEKLYNPHLDISDDGKNIAVVAELPGLQDKDIDLAIERDRLTIKGEKREEKSETKKDYSRQERYFGSFSRIVTLPAPIDVAKAQATYKDGVLRVIMPKLEMDTAKPRKVAVKTTA